MTNIIKCALLLWSIGVMALIIQPPTSIVGLICSYIGVALLHLKKSDI